MVSGWISQSTARDINTNTPGEKNVLIRFLCNHTNLNSRGLYIVMCYFGQASCGAVLLFGKINEHLFFNVSNSISRLVSGAPAQCFSAALAPNSHLWAVTQCHRHSHSCFYSFHISSFIYRLARLAQTQGPRTGGIERLTEDNIISLENLLTTDSEGSCH